MFKKYRMYCYIRRKGKVARSDIEKRFRFPGAMIDDLTGVDNVDGELSCYEGIVELRAPGLEYIEMIRREVCLPFIVALFGAFLGALFGTLSGYSLGRFLS